jgi:sn-glycerol 3-phosphate transport system permease protein
MLLPALLLLLAFSHWPVMSTLIDSFHSTPKGVQPSVWVGLQNYRAIVDDPVFWKALRNNLWFAGITIVLSIGLALVMALWVNERIPGRAFLRMAYFTPTVLPMIAVANIWLFFYTPQYGLLEQVTGALGLPAHNWLGSPEAALGAVTVVAVWKEAGFFMIFYLELIRK